MSLELQSVSVCRDLVICSYGVLTDLLPLRVDCQCSSFSRNRCVVWWGDSDIIEGLSEFQSSTAGVTATLSTRSALCPCVRASSAVMAESGVRVPQEPFKASAVVDERIDFIREQAFTCLRLKTDKWNRFIAAEENQKLLLDFLDKGCYDRMVLFTGPGGTLHVGDGQVLVSVLVNVRNHGGWPRVVSEDICKHIEKLKSRLVTLRGRSEGRTLLPLPLCVERSDMEDILHSPAGWPIDRALLYSIETMVIQWSHQIWDILKKDSSQALLQGENPGPTVEIDFWVMQRDNLLGIQRQIQNPKVEKIMEILKRIKSSYYSSFCDIILKVNEAVLEAVDIELHLRPLKKHIARLEERSFTHMELLIAPLFHTLCLIWSHSRYYCIPGRMVVLLQEFCNLLIEKAFAYLIPEELFKMELEEGVERVQQTIQVIKSFKRTFHQHREKISQYYQGAGEVKPWDFPSSLVFQRTDCILERLLMIEELFASALDFLKLEKIELGGSRGKILSDIVYSMNEEFHDSWRILRESKYDPLDYTKKDFLSDYTRFMEQNKDFDQRLGTVLNLAFQHSRGLESAFKLLQIFGTLLERPRINSLFAPNYTILLHMFEEEMNCCQQILDCQKEKMQNGSAALGKNMPLVAGSLKWAQELRDRILTSRSSLNLLTHMPLGSSEAVQVLKKCEKLLEVLDQHDEEIYCSWTEGLEELCNTHLQEPLLTLSQDTGLFQLNFNPTLTSVLREVKYLDMLKYQNIPKAALQLYSKKETLYMYTQTLSLVSQWFNRLQSTILDVELHLVEKEMEKTRQQLRPALESLTWGQDDLWEYILQTRDLVQSMDSRVQKSKSNVEAVQELMNGISHTAFITRKTSRSGNLLIISDMEEIVRRKYDLITSTGEKIHQLVQENQTLLGADPDSSEWRAYTEYVDRMVLQGFISAIRCSLQYFIENTDPTLKITPLFEVQLVLNGSDMTFRPPLDITKKDNFYDIIDKTVDQIFKMASFIPRVARHNQQETYQPDVDELAELAELSQIIRSRARSAIARVKEFQSSFSSYCYLWMDDRVEFMRQFLLYGHGLSTEEAELYADYELTKNPPKLENFKEQDTDKGLSNKVADGDYAGLVEIMGHLMAIRDRQITTDQHFKPLKSTADLLKTYGQQLPEQVYTQLEELPEKWKNLKKVAFTVKHEVAPLQSNEVSVIRRKCVRFETNRAVVQLETEMKKLQETADLFEVSFPDYKQLRQCRSDIILVKSVWDMVIFVKEMKTLDKEVRAWDVYTGLEATVKNLLTSLRAVNELQNSAVRERHWQQLMSTTGVSFVMDEATTLGALLELQLHRVEEEVKNIVDKAVKEMGIEKVLTEINGTWSLMTFSYEKHQITGTPLLKSDQNLIETLEDNQVQLQNILMSKYVEYFLVQVSTWQRKLMVADLVISIWMDVQRTWAHLQSIFTNSEDIRNQLAQDAMRFQGIHLDFQVTRHLLKLFDNLADLKFSETEMEGEKAVAVGMFSREGEYVPFSESCVCEGQAECWLGELEATMRCTIQREIMEAVAAYEDKPRDQWLLDFPAQVALTGSQIWWATDVGIAFQRVEEGFETALKDYNRKQITQLNALINMLLGELSTGDRQKIMTICTIDVHARDVVAKLIAQKVTNGQAFAWLSQLRHRWDDDRRHCYINICDAQFQFSYEYLGNTHRLVITPLTDRCYITLTQSLHLTMSGAPSGPAGTGKTETTKDLGRSLGIMVYVFNCSEQMDYKSIGNIYKGLAQTGVWGCFDEFNRISVEVLFHFLGEEIELKPTVGIFITLNPGYAGRTELPENLKALFRPCAMVIPDFELICEIMLVAEGFLDARQLARKFISLYTLCRELLSKQDHYDWGLRAIKSVLVVAGSLKRGDRSNPEDQVLMRALRDFNLPKIVTNDVPIFLGLISDLFPLLDVPRKRDPDLEQAVRQSVAELHLQPEENFILKVTQLEELLAVRHSVFVVGSAGTGKSQILKTLFKTFTNMKIKPVWNDINPKAVTTDELFGFLHPATREWKDGLFSSTMRELSRITHDGPKWIVLDGDIDPMWIESLNTVMDDNKVLTLASNERISLTSSMRLVFEISHLRAATPATVSRAGILYVNPQDLGWSS
ncbi:hypothetical protein AGOR_G00062710 [Albula goreensis]|uniref:Uncharacterized protein n=1 Tax=Albula goreensis TaxID=1534307 RepID=A0A8T3DVU2_9TELE|nr:hypothetical protein AGOR_G00062710 [Albula goreensis]